MSILQILFLVFSGLFLISSILQLIGRAKKIRLMECICKPMIHAFLLADAYAILLQHLPDSFTIIVCLSISAVAMLANSIFAIFPRTKKNMIALGICFELALLPWIHLLFPSFALFPLPNAFMAIAVAAYIALFSIFFILVPGARNYAAIAGTVFFHLPLIILHYASILTAIGQPKIYSFVMVAGTTFLLASQIMYLRRFFTELSTLDRFVRSLLFTISIFLITAGFVLMVSL